jgi:hypothetical protein
MQKSDDLMTLVAGIGLGAAAALLLAGREAVGARLVQTKTALRALGERVLLEINSAVKAAPRNYPFQA